MTSLADLAIRLLEKKSTDTLLEAKGTKRKMKDLLNAVEADHMARVNGGSCLPEVSILYLELLENLRKIYKNVANIIDRAEMFYDKLPKQRPGAPA